MRAMRACVALLSPSIEGVSADHTKVTWTTPTPEPGKNTKGQPVCTTPPLTVQSRQATDRSLTGRRWLQVISGGMPVGNGEVVANVWVDGVRNGSLALLFGRSDVFSGACGVNSQQAWSREV